MTEREVLLRLLEVSGLAGTMPLKAGEHSPPGCGSARPRAEHDRTETNQIVWRILPHEWAARAQPAAPVPGGRAPQFKGIIPAEMTEEKRALNTKIYGTISL